MQKRKGNKLTVITAIAAAVVVLVFLNVFGFWNGLYLFFGFRENLSENKLTAAFLNVGIADCCVLSTGSQTVMIDCGDNSGNDIITHYLNQNNIQQIDLIIISHFDSDHCNQLTNIVRQFDVKEVITSKPMSASDSALDIIKQCENEGVLIEYKGFGDIINKDDIKISVLSPDSAFKSDNDNSLVVKVDSFGKSLLFTGDAGESVEKAILKKNIDLDCNIIKAAHHGSGTSCLNDFLSAADPEYAVVSVGLNNYGLPSLETVSRLENAGAEVFRTDKTGTVKFYISDNEITVKKEY